VDARIPQAYAQYWEPFQTNETLYHLTTSTHLRQIRENGLEPRDPAPKYWAGMKAIFMGYPSDPGYERNLRDVLAHVREKGLGLTRLHIKTRNTLYKSTDPARTFQVMTLDPISPTEIVEVEPLEG
jgi:hypothetical protein